MKNNKHSLTLLRDKLMLTLNLLFSFTAALTTNAHDSILSTKSISSSYTTKSNLHPKGSLKMSSVPTSAVVVDLKSIQCGSLQQNPKVVFLHGLDSSSHTWRDILPIVSSDNDDVPCIAFDLRGCGKSPTGRTIEDFSQDTLIEDVHTGLMKHKYLIPPQQQEKEKDSDDTNSNWNNNKIILVGHSLGGRLALAYAAKYPQYVSVLVIEDMDIVQRPKEKSVIPIPPDVSTDTFQPFHRKLTSLQEVIDTLQQRGYPQERIDKYVKEGRIHKFHDNDDNDDATNPTCYWWCDVNPDFRTLCYHHILDTQRGVNDWNTLCGAGGKTATKYSFPCHVLVANPDMGGVCFQESTDEMERLMNNNDQVEGEQQQHHQHHCYIHHFPTANHSIHNSARDEFLSTLKKIIQGSRMSTS